MAELLPPDAPRYSDRLFTYVLIGDTVYFFPHELGWEYRGILRNPSREVLQKLGVNVQ